MLEVTGDSAATQHLLDAATYYSPTYDVCQKSVDMAVDQYCGGYSDYSLKYSRVMVNLCETTKGDTVRIVKAVAKVCSE